MPFVLDRLLVSRLTGAPRTLVYPLAAVVIDYMLVLEPFHANFGSPAYTQYGDLPLMQLVSLTGVWGLTFLVSWLAPVVNEDHDGLRTVRNTTGGNTDSGRLNRTFERWHVKRPPRHRQD